MKTAVKSAMLFAALAIGASSSATVSAASSTFDSDDDGWRFVDLGGQEAVGGPNFTTILSGPSVLSYAASGGNPGGFIFAQDPSNQTFFLDAPAKFLGDQSSMYGGSLKFDVKTSPTAPEWTGDPDVLLISGTNVLVFDFPENPGTSFLTRNVPLIEGLWKVGGLGGAAATQAEFQSTLGALTALRIRGEYVSSIVGQPATLEITSLDNISMSPVPEPAIALMMPLGILLVAAALRRRNRSTA